MVMLLVDEAHYELLSAAVLHSALGAVRSGTTELWVRSRPHHRIKIVKLPDGNFRLVAEYVAAAPKPPARPPPPAGTMPKNVPMPKMMTTRGKAAPKVKAMPKTKATTKAKATSSTTTTPLLPTPKRTGTLKRCLDLTSVPETQLAENAMDCT